MSIFAIVGSLLGVKTGMDAEAIYQQGKANKANRKAQEVNRKIEERQRKREQMDQLRQAQIARAQALAAGVNSGTADTSGLQGQVASISSQAASNIAYSNQVQTGANVIGMYQQKAAKATELSGNWEALAKLTMQASSFY